MSLPRILLSIVCLAALATTGCGDSHQKVMDDSIALMREIETTLAGIADDAGAKRAAAQLENIATRMDAIKQRSAALGAPDQATADSLRDTYAPQMLPLVERIGALQRHLQSVPHLPGELRVAFDKIHTVAR